MQSRKKEKYFDKSEKQPETKVKNKEDYVVVNNNPTVGFFYYLARAIIMAVVVIIIILTFFLRIVNVDGRSMMNTLLDNEDRKSVV